MRQVKRSAPSHVHIRRLTVRCIMKKTRLHLEHKETTEREKKIGTQKLKNKMKNNNSVLQQTLSRWYFSQLFETCKNVFIFAKTLRFRSVSFTRCFKNLIFKKKSFFLNDWTITLKIGSKKSGKNNKHWM